ncbi:hypothetical protein MYCTH_2118373 [Thermothelomyces thermophilus ATCC 42464]|uniref:Uncharacterized protein n=1 Tax=Thermothelomyces thermophilus (strain ATCC 42464 / BCRC 31852 / DSM 1799) TaxID=573729 RepID=G2QBF5_THET4|nr:uncharacterized protein MYCTH_2118373 [Thermothelomyces thermophilus ATCC 42464]AEO57898.1 hypothetical protein MYCTH_2118373 [Thermothelomyces thermophilus ATCC 42464]
MASTASALSLSQFQPITSATIPLSCILAYDTEIPGCAISDFVEGATCSSSCLRGLRRLEYALQIVCDDADAPKISLLGQALEGNLAAVLCPGRSPDATMSSSSSSPTLVPPNTTTLTTTLAATQRTQLTFTTVQPPSTTLTRSTARTETDTETGTGRRAESKTEEPTTSISSTSTSPTSTVTSDTPRPTFVQFTSSTTASPSSTSTAEAPEETDGVRSGGFTPFELFPNSSTQLITSWMTAVAISLAVSFLLL